MRLLECGDGPFVAPKKLVGDLPRYAILSHTWGPDTEEVTFQDLANGTGRRKSGYRKLEFCAAQAKRDGLRHIWVDTCCIDKLNMDEVSESINSMFDWYQKADRCYVYLSDVTTNSDKDHRQQSGHAWEPAFRASKWFTRSWTLQELLAPASVEFFSADGHRLGDKRSLEQQIHDITGIAVPALQGHALASFDVEQRFAWAASREATREEDGAYCLFGIFGVYLPLIYGEKKPHAMYRLRTEIAAAASQSNEPNGNRAKKRTWIVPFDENPSFTGRESELESLRRALFTGRHTAKVAITGLGGIGKTQLALAFAYQIQNERPDCSVIWILASSKENIGRAYHAAAQQLGIAGCEDDKADMKRLVQDHLSSDSAGRWLLIFDNADDISMWTDKSDGESDRLIDYLPKNQQGSIIFTTRDKKAAVWLAHRNIIDLQAMDEATSKKLFGSHLLDDHDLLSNQDTTALLSRLTYLPLAIVQAAAYINANNIGLGDYLSLLNTREEDVIELLDEDFEHDSVPRSVAATWLVSFSQVKQKDPLAADYLSFIACVDTDDIPWTLLPPGSSQKKVTDAMGTLQSYSFIAKRSADATISIHKLVHLAMRNWLRKEGLLCAWTCKATVRLVEVLSDINKWNMAEWRTYMPHACYTLESSPNSEDDEDKLNLLQMYGLCLYYDGRYNEAETLQQRVADARKTTLGVDHPDTLTSMNSLASTILNQGRWEEAEKLQVQVMNMTKTKLGVDHPGTLTVMNNLASTFRKQGRWEEAEKLQVQVLNTRKTKLGVDHPDTLTSMNSLASTILNQGRWEEAEKLQVQVLNMTKTKLGVDHPDTLTIINNLASTFHNQGRWEEAEKLQVQVLNMTKTKLGVDHPDTLTSMDNLASTISDQGRWEEAEKLQVQVLNTTKTKLGVDHPDTLVSMNSLAMTFHNQGRWEEAEKLQVQVLNMTKTKLGVDHFGTLTIMNNLASTILNQGRWEEAEKLQVQVLNTRKTKLGVDHPDTLAIMNNLAMTFRKQGRWEEAEKLQVQVLNTRKTKLGVDHPETLTSMHNLACNWRSQGRHAEALAMMKDCASARQRVLGLEHPYTLASMAWLEEWS